MPNLTTVQCAIDTGVDAHVAMLRIAKPKTVQTPEDIGSLADSLQGNASPNKVFFSNAQYSKKFFRALAEYNKNAAESGNPRILCAFGENDLDYICAAQSANIPAYDKHKRSGSGGQADGLNGMTVEAYKDSVCPIVSVLQAPNRAYGNDSRQKHAALLAAYKESLVAMAQKAETMGNVRILMPFDANQHKIQIGTGIASRALKTPEEKQVVQNMIWDVCKAINQGVPSGDIAHMLEGVTVNAAGHYTGAVLSPDEAKHKAAKEGSLVLDEWRSKVALPSKWAKMPDPNNPGFFTKLSNFIVAIPRSIWNAVTGRTQPTQAPAPAADPAPGILNTKPQSPSLVPAKEQPKPAGQALNPVVTLQENSERKVPAAGQEHSSNRGGGLG